MLNHHRQVLNPYLAGLFEMLHRIRFGEVRWQIEERGLGQLWIDDAVAPCHGTCQYIPVRRNIVQHRIQATVSLLRGCCPYVAFGDKQEDREDDKDPDRTRPTCSNHDRRILRSLSVHWSPVTGKR